ADALMSDNPLVAAEHGDQVPEEVEEQVHGPFRPVRRPWSAAGPGQIAFGEEGSVAVEQHADPVVLEAVEAGEWVDDDIDVQPLGSDAETADEPGDGVCEHCRPGDHRQYVGPMLLEP